MRENINASTVNYLNARKGIIERTFVWMIVKNRSSGAIEEVGFCNYPYDVAATVISGQTGLPVLRNYVGAGALLEVEDINLVSDLTIQTLRAKFSQSNAEVNNAIRGYDARNGKIEVHYGLLDLSTRLLVDTPYPHFVGIINKAPIKRAKVGASGGVGLEAVSRTRELTITNPNVKSDEFQQHRFPGDDFRKYGTVAHQWAVWWGEAKDIKLTGEKIVTAIKNGKN